MYQVLELPSCSWLKQGFSLAVKLRIFRYHEKNYPQFFTKSWSSWSSPEEENNILRNNWATQLLLQQSIWSCCCCHLSELPRTSRPWWKTWVILQLRCLCQRHRVNLPNNISALAEEIMEPLVFLKSGMKMMVNHGEKFISAGSLVGNGYRNFLYKPTGVQDISTI